ncbi:hypothetical protein MAH1_21120 [Sessilibacter sp. MAH1]
MATHRVGDSYLSDAEYTQHQIETWLAIVFVAGALSLELPLTGHVRVIGQKGSALY